MADKASLKIEIEQSSLTQIQQVRLGYIEASDPRRFRRMLQLATLNAARTMVKPIKAGAPVLTGRLKGAVAARKARTNGPAAVVGVKGGKTRGDAKGAWYRWFVVSGHNVRGAGKSKGRRISGPTWAQIGMGATSAATGTNVKRVPGNDFVGRATQDSSNQSKAMSTIQKTIMAFLDGTITSRTRRR